MVFHWRGYKNHYFQPSPKTSPNVFGNVFEFVQKSIKRRSGCIVEKTTKINAKNNANCTKNHPQRVSHESGFRILKCIWAGLWARWAPRPPHTAPRPPQTTIFAHLAAFWCDFSSIRGVYFRKLLAVFGARFCAFGNELPTKLVNETNSERRFKRARWRGCAQRSWIIMCMYMYLIYRICMFRYWF